MSPNIKYVTKVYLLGIKFYRLIKNPELVTSTSDKALIYKKINEIRYP